MYPNDKNLKIIEMSWREYVAVTDSWGLCDLCGQNSSEEPIYYIALLKQYYCKPCLDAYLSGAKRYKSDLEKEQYNFVEVKHKLEDLGCFNG